MAKLGFDPKSYEQPFTRMPHCCSVSMCLTWTCLKSFPKSNRCLESHHFSLGIKATGSVKQYLTPLLYLHLWIHRYLVSLRKHFSVILVLQRGFPDSSLGKESACNAGDPRLIPGWGRSPGEGIGYPLQYSWVSLVAQQVKKLPTMQETWVPSLGWEDPLEKGKATHSSILAWRIPWTV